MVNRQEWYTLNDDANGTLIEDLVQGTNQSAQTFTIGASGDNLTFNLSSVEVLLARVSGDTGADFEAMIFETDPAGAPANNITYTNYLSKGTLTIQSSGFSTTPTWFKIDMSGTLERNKQYALVVWVEDTNDLIWREDASSPTYTGGNVLTTTNLGRTWTKVAGSDKIFQINGGSYAGTLCTKEEAINKSGANPNSVATNEIMVSDFVIQAEGTIAATTRFDWVKIYDTLNTDVKGILTQVASDLAAIYMVQYDMSGYTSRIEAEDMVNILRDSSLRGLSILRDKKQQDFLVAA